MSGTLEKGEIPVTLRATTFVMAVVLFAGAPAAADWTPGRSFDDYFSKTAYKDRDWNVTFYDNCGLPQYSSVDWVREEGEKFLRFTLKDEDVGKCGRDTVYRMGAPYHERAEVKQTHLMTKGVNYTLTFRARFLKGFRWHRESFLQIHQGVKGCRVPPLTKLEFRGGNLRWSSPPVRIEELHGKWIDVRFDFNTETTWDLYFDGKKVISDGPYFEPHHCGEPHFKLGIYRPGDPRADGDRLSVLDVDKVRLTERK